MASRVPKAAPAKLPGIQVGQITNFSGGVNFRDSPTELAATESYDAYNVTFDERGGVQSRLGYVKRGSSLAASIVVNDFYSALLGNFITQAGTGLYYNGTLEHTFTTNDCVTFAELGGKVIVGHPVDGLFYSTDGITWTHITSANAPATANCIKTWMSKLFVGLADGTVHWSAASDPLTWASTDFNAIWTKDQKPVVALAIGSGQDIQGRPGLLVFKQESVYRINDSGTGAYTVLDTTHGAAGPKAVVGVGARVCWIGKGGIWWWREDQASPINGSDLLRPLWRNEQLSFSNQSGWAAGRRLNRAYFSASSQGSAVNDTAIEFHPDEGWVTLRSDAMTCYSVDQNEQTYGGSPTVNGQMYQLDTGGTDDGTAISGWFQTRWVVPNGGFQAQVWQLRLHGRGSGTIEFRKDYEDSMGKQYTITYPTTGWFYDTTVTYDSGISYIDPVSAASVSLAGQGTCRQFSIRFTFSTNSTFVGRQIGTAPAPVYGGNALYGIETLYIPLGFS